VAVSIDTAGLQGIAAVARKAMAVMQGAV